MSGKTKANKTGNDSEASAMNAWLRMLEGEQPPVYEATAVPVRDPSSQSVLKK